MKLELKEDRKNVVLYFGSFNPVHSGHLELAHSVLEKSGADELWFVLSPLNPQKKKAGMLSYDLRKELLLRAFNRYPKKLAAKIYLCQIETRLPEPHYTIRSLRALEMLYPEISFSIAMGADVMQRIRSWHQYERVLDEVQLIVYPRDTTHYEKKQMEQNPSYTYIDNVQCDISSSEIRESFKKGIFSIPGVISMPPELEVKILDELDDNDNINE